MMRDNSATVAELDSVSPLSASVAKHFTLARLDSLGETGRLIHVVPVSRPTKCWGGLVPQYFQNCVTLTFATARVAPEHRSSSTDRRCSFFHWMTWEMTRWLR